MSPGFQAKLDARVTYGERLTACLDELKWLEQHAPEARTCRLLIGAHVNVAGLELATALELFHRGAVLAHGDEGEQGSESTTATPRGEQSSKQVEGVAVVGPESAPATNVGPEEHFCAWCKTWFEYRKHETGTVFAVHYEREPANGAVSHAICVGCAEKFNEQGEAMQ